MVEGGWGIRLSCSNSWTRNTHCSLWRGRSAWYDTLAYEATGEIRRMNDQKQVQERIQNEQAIKLILARKKDSKWLKQVETLRTRIKTFKRSTDAILRALEIKGWK